MKIAGRWNDNITLVSETSETKSLLRNKITAETTKRL